MEETVTFTANSRVLGYRPGQVIKIKKSNLTKIHVALLKVGKHLALIDPLEIEDGSKKSTDNPEKSGPADTAGGGNGRSSSSGKSQAKSSADSGERNGGDGSTSGQSSSSEGNPEGEAYSQN